MTFVVKKVNPVAPRLHVCIFVFTFLSYVERKWVAGEMEESVPVCLEPEGSQCYGPCCSRPACQGVGPGLGTDMVWGSKPGTAMRTSLIESSPTTEWMNIHSIDWGMCSFGPLYLKTVCIEELYQHGTWTMELKWRNNDHTEHVILGLRDIHWNLKSINKVWRWIFICLFFMR